MMKNKGFTLVELIVVVTILAILATIGFVSYSSYLVGVRDANRAAQLVSLSDGMELYRTKKDLPLPDDNVEVLYGSEVLSYQGDAGSNTLETIDFTKGGVDPKTGEYFTYYLTQDRKYFQLMALFEEEISTIDQSNVYVDSPLNADVFGKNLGVLTNGSNIPIQKIPALLTTGLDISDVGTNEYIAYLKNGYAFSGSGTDLLTLKPLLKNGGNSFSCKDILESEPTAGDGIYNIVNGGKSFEVYCNMLTDGGGWTLIDGTSDRFGALTPTNYGGVPNTNNYGMDVENLEALLSSITEPIFKYSIEGGGESFEFYIQIHDLQESVRKGHYINYDSIIPSTSWVTKNLTTTLQSKKSGNYTRYNLRSRGTTWVYSGHLKSYSESIGPHGWWLTDAGSVEQLYLNKTILDAGGVGLPTFGGRLMWHDTGSTMRLQTLAGDNSYSTDPSLTGQIKAGFYVK